MSYSDNVYKALAEQKKKKKKNDDDIAPVSTGDSFSDKVYAELRKREKEIDSLSLSGTQDVASFTQQAQEDDIAPVLGGNKNSVFKSGAFSDGVDGVGDFFEDLGQTVLGTIGDLSIGLVKGVGNLAEGVVDLGTYGVAGVASLFGQDDFAQKTKDFAQKNLVNDFYGDSQEWVDQYSVLGNKADAVSEGLGQVAGIILTGGLGEAAGLTSAGVSALTTGTMVASGMGGGMSEAYQGGASDGEAVAYGATVGAIEAISEMIFGGLGKGVQALGLSKGLTSIDDVFAKKLSNTAAKFITSEVGQRAVGNALEYAVKSGAEGLEEVISGFGTAIAKDLFLLNGEDEKAFGEILKDENLLEQFVVGSIVSGITQGGDLISSTKSGRDFVSGLSKNEQSVVDKVFEERLEEESKTRKISNTEKNKLYDQVVEEMKTGRIDTDTIERILGGETYKGYKNLTEQETSLTDRKKAIEKEISSLVKTPEKQFTVEQRETLNSLRDEARGIKAQIKGLDTKTAKSNLFNEVNKLTSNDTFLRESYNQREKRGQAFTADLNKYKGKQREAVKRAIDSGVLNDTYRSHELVDTLSRLEAEKGIVFDYTNNKKLAQSGMALKGKTINGFEKDGVVTLNVQSSKAWQSTVGHEITHVLEGTEAYSALQEALIQYSQSKGDYQSRYDSLVELYKGVKGYETDFEAKIKKELTADLVGDYLFSDKAFVDRLVGNRTLFQKVWDEIKYLCKIATGKELTEIEKVNREFERAWKEYGQVVEEEVNNENGVYNDPAVNFSISISKDIENSDNSWYNEIKLPTAEQERVQSEALTWNAGRRNQLITQTLSNEITYRYMIDDDGIVHIYEREAIVDIHEMGEDYGNTDTTQPDSIAEELWTGQRDNGGDSWISQDGRKPGKDDTNDHRFVSGDGRSDGTGYSKNRANAYGRPKKRGWHFNEDGSTDVTYSDGTKTKEDIAPKKEVSSTDDAFFDGENANTNFSLSKSVEETNDLMALHNLNASELIKTLELGGLPMPSIAVIKAQQGHEKYGDVSLIFPKDTIDPQANKDNKVYGGDAWTPVYPRIEYKANEAIQSKVREKYYEFAEKYGYDAARPLYRYAHELESALNSEQGEANLLDWLYKDTKLMQVYLEDSGKGKVEDIVKETRAEASESDKQMSQWFIDKLGEDFIRAFKAPKGESPLSYRKNYIEDHKAEIASAWESFCREVYQITEEQVQNVMRDTNGAMYMKFMRNAEQYLNNGGVTIKTETDYDATERAIEEKAADGYKEWVDSLFKGAQEKTGIRNDKDTFTSRGDRRSWDALHWENTLENVVRAMKTQDQTGADAFSPASAIFAVAHKRYDSIADVKADSDRLGRVSEDEYKAMEEEYASRLAQIANTIKDPNERNPFTANDRAAQEIIDAVRNYKTKAGMLRYMQKWNSRVTESTVDDILSLVNDIANMPTGYFEAKPQRAVGLEEVGVFVIPNNADVKLKQELLNRGYSIAEYDPNVEGDRQRVVNQFEEYKFSLSNVGDKFTPTGNYSTPLSETALDGDIAPVADGVAENATGTNVGHKTADNPVVNPVDENAPVEEAAQTVDEKISAKLKNLQTELDNNLRLRGESNADFDSEIARLRAEYEAKKNKNTKVANDVLRRIERIQRLKGNVDADYQKRITGLQERIQKMQTPQYRRGEQRRAKQEKWSNEIKALIGDTSTWVDKKLGIFYQTNTLRRNLRDVVRDANGNRDIAKADAIYEYLQGSYNHNEALLKRESRDIKQPFADMEINKHESEYIQMLGEFKYNPETKLTLEAVDEYYGKHKDNIDLDKVNRAIDEARKVYDDLFKRVNAVLREMGLKEMGYKEGYFPHFTDTKQGWLAKLFNWKTIDTEIPTDIAGITEEFNPVRTYQSFDKHRKSDETDYNFLKGFDTYVHGALDWIYHIEDIQKRRAFENEIRYSHSEQGLRDKVAEIINNKDLDSDEVQALLDNVYAEAKNPLNNFVTDLRNSTNNLAGKKSTTDRSMEYATNRKVYSTMTNISNRVSANMVVGSVSSALTNFIPITQSWGQVNPVSSLRAVGDVVRNAINNDGMIEKSDFMTNRLLNEENLDQTGWDKASKVAGGLMNIFDHFTTEVVWRSKFIENMSNGMSESEAIHDADIFAENVMAGRSRGNMPTIYNSKNPITKMLTAFQLEVGNQYGYMFKDLPQDVGKDNIGKLTAGYAKMFIGAYVYNALFSKLTGRDAAFDPIGILEDLLKDLGFGDDDEEEEVDVLGAVQGFGENIVQEIPYVGGLLGGGRIPISSALPYDSITKMVSGTMTDIAENDWESLTNEWLNPVYYLALPFGGGQLKKTNEGLAMFSDDHPVSGSYTASGNLRFPVEDTPLNRTQAALFGQYASENAREYFDNDYAPLKEKQIQEYIDVDIPIKDYWEYREGLKKQETLEDKFDYIAGLDLPVEKKNILINNVVDRKDKVDLGNYDDFSSLEEFDFATKSPDKYAIAKTVGGYSSYKQYASDLNDIKADRDEYGKTISGSRKEKVIQYINGLNADYETKIILYKSEYPSDDTYNADIINYVNSRADLTYEERVAILTELGFRVVNGNIYAD